MRSLPSSRLGRRALVFLSPGSAFGPAPNPYPQFVQAISDSIGFDPMFAGAQLLTGAQEKIDEWPGADQVRFGIRIRRDPEHVEQGLKCRTSTVDLVTRGWITRRAVDRPGKIEDRGHRFRRIEIIVHCRFELGPGRFGNAGLKRDRVASDSAGVQGGRDALKTALGGLESFVGEGQWRSVMG